MVGIQWAGIMRISRDRDYLRPNIPEAMKMAIVVLQRVSAEGAFIRMAEQQFGQGVE